MSERVEGAFVRFFDLPRIPAAQALPKPTTPIRWLLATVLIGGIVNGAVMGSYGGLGENGRLQIFFSAIKVPMLLMVTFALSLPSFFVLNSLVGLRADFPQALRALLATQATVGLALGSLAPYTALWYASSDNYRLAVLSNGAIFAIASFMGQWALGEHYGPLIRNDPRHRPVLRAWLIVYVFVGIQMGYVLRPFIGSPEMATRFFRAEAWGNAYVVVASMVWNQLMGK